MFTMCYTMHWYTIRARLEVGLIDKDDAIDDYYLNGLKTLNEPVKIVDPEWNDWLEENQHLVKPTGLMEGLVY